MKKILLIAILTAGLTVAGDPVPPSDLIDTLWRMAIEIKSLQLDVRRLEVDLFSQRLASLQREQVQLQASLARLEREEKDLREEAARLDKLRQADLLSDADRRALAGVEANRDQRPGSEIERVLAATARFVLRLDEINLLISREGQRLQRSQVLSSALEAELRSYRTPAAAQP